MLSVVIAVRLRTLLALTVVTLTASIVLAGGWLLYSLWQRQREVMDRQNVELARAVSVAIDQSVENARAALTLMASVDVLDTDELTRFRELARRVIPRQPGWHSVLLADSSGRLLINTAAQRDPDGTSVDTDWAAPVIATLKPHFSNLVIEPGLPGYFFTAAVPVVRAGRLSHVLAVRIRTESLSAIIHQQQIPKNGVVTLERIADTT